MSLGWPCVGLGKAFFGCLGIMSFCVVVGMVSCSSCCES